MRLRHAMTAALGALVLVTTVPTSAVAATGQFRYTYTTSGDHEAVGFLNNPPSRKCINLKGVGSDDLAPGHSPKNRTGATAIVFLRADCEGAQFFSLSPRTGGGSERMKVRSVVFS